MSRGAGPSFLPPVLTGPVLAARLAPIEVTATTTATLDRTHIVTATATLNDPTPAQGRGYEVIVRNGTATVGGTAYAAGLKIRRYYHSGAWANAVEPSWSGTPTTGRLVEWDASGNVVNSLIEDGVTAGVLTLAKTGSAARTATFPDAAITVAGQNINNAFSVAQTINSNGTIGVDVVRAGTIGIRVNSTSVVGSAQLIFANDGSQVAALDVTSETLSIVGSTTAGKTIDFKIGSAFNTRLSIAGDTGMATFSGTGVTVTSSTASTSTATGALVVTGGVGVGGNLYAGGAIVCTNAGTGEAVITATATGTLSGALTDGFTSAIGSAPAYTGAFAVTRHNYINISDVSLAGGATLTDACVFRFPAAAGTHKAVDSGTTKTSPGTVSAWVKININGTIHYMPAYTSKTT